MDQCRVITLHRTISKVSRAVELNKIQLTQESFGKLLSQGADLLTDLWDNLPAVLQCHALDTSIEGKGSGTQSPNS